MGHKRKILEARRITKRRKKLIKSEDYLRAKRQCFNKTAYRSEKLIIGKINKIAEEGRRSLRYYECPICSLWHISSHKMEGQTFIS